MAPTLGFEPRTYLLPNSFATLEKGRLTGYFIANAHDYWAAFS
jgi:hypothetical protein